MPSMRSSNGGMGAYEILHEIIKAPQLIEKHDFGAGWHVLCESVCP